MAAQSYEKAGKSASEIADSKLGLRETQKCENELLQLGAFVSFEESSHS